MGTVCESVQNFRNSILLQYSHSFWYSNVMSMPYTHTHTHTHTYTHTQKNNYTEPILQRVVMPAGTLRSHVVSPFKLQQVK